MSQGRMAQRFLQDAQLAISASIKLPAYTNFPHSCRARYQAMVFAFKSPLLYILGAAIRSWLPEHSPRQLNRTLSFHYKRFLLWASHKWVLGEQGLHRDLVSNLTPPPQKTDMSDVKLYMIVYYLIVTVLKSLGTRSPNGIFELLEYYPQAH